LRLASAVLVLFSDDRSQLVNARASDYCLACQGTTASVTSQTLGCPAQHASKYFSGLSDQSRRGHTQPQATPCHAAALTHRSEQRIRGTGAEHTIVSRVVVILTRVTNDICVTTMTIVKCGALALCASKTRQGVNGTNTQGWRRGRRTQRKPTSTPRSAGASLNWRADRRSLGAKSHSEPRAARGSHHSLDRSDQ
jgi:hypothetical protein